MTELQEEKARKLLEIPKWERFDRMNSVGTVMLERDGIVISQENYGNRNQHLEIVKRFSKLSKNLTGQFVIIVHTILRKQ